LLTSVAGRGRCWRGDLTIYIYILSQHVIEIETTYEDRSEHLRECCYSEEGRNGSEHCRNICWFSEVKIWFIKK
jgi:hypothetical protein